MLDLNLREKLILGCIVVAVFALGLFPAEPMSKTELAARQYQQLVASHRTGTTVALRTDDEAIALSPCTGCRTANARRDRAMSWQTIFTAMLPEHMLLAGIVVLIGLEIASQTRAAFVVSRHAW